MTDVYAPLYEGRILSFFDHRAAVVVKSATAQHRQNQPRYLTDDEKDDPNREALGLYWVDEAHVDEALADRWNRDWLVGWSSLAPGMTSRLVRSECPASNEAIRLGISGQWQRWPVRT